MPNLCYISATLTPDWTQLDSLSDCLFLIVSTSNYSTRTPVLLRTTIITSVFDLTREGFGSTFLQDADLHTSWYLAFRYMPLREREQRRNGNRFGIVKSVEIDRIIIPPSGSVKL